MVFPAAFYDLPREGTFKVVNGTEPLVLKGLSNEDPPGRFFQPIPRWAQVRRLGVVGGSMVIVRTLGTASVQGPTYFPLPSPATWGPFDREGAVAIARLFDCVSRGKSGETICREVVKVFEETNDW